MYRTHRQHSLLSSGGVPSFIGGLVVFVSAAFNAQAETWFDPAFFKDDPSMVADLSRFEKGQKITPGVYRVDIVLNQTIVDTRNVNFVEITPEKGIAACLTTESLDAMVLILMRFRLLNNWTNKRVCHWRRLFRMPA